MKKLMFLTALAVGCTAQAPKSSGGDDQPSGTDHHHDNNPPGALVCESAGAPGTVLATYSITGGAIVATDAFGSVFYTAAQGFVKLDVAGNRVYDFAFGSVLAVDAAGNPLVAGSFAGSIDFGGGHVLRNSGDFDGFVVMLDPLGNHLWSIDLGDAQLPVNVIGYGQVTTPRDQNVTAIAINAD